MCNCAIEAYQKCVADTAVCFVPSSEVLLGEFNKVFRGRSHHVGWLVSCHSSGDAEGSYCLRKQDPQRHSQI